MNQSSIDQQFVIFELDEEEFAVPILEVKEIVKNIQITPVPDSPDYILGVINLRGKIAPILDMEKRFSLIRNMQVASEHILMYEDDKENLYGIRVDKVKGVIKISPAAIKPTPKVVSSKISGDYLNGVIIIEQSTTNEERIILILNLPKILDEATAKEAIDIANKKL